ncbi:unnamed protein product [Durusdinium trenchii]
MPLDKCRLGARLAASDLSFSSSDDGFAKLLSILAFFASVETRVTVRLIPNIPDPDRSPSSSAPWLSGDGISGCEIAALCGNGPPGGSKRCGQITPRGVDIWSIDHESMRS